MFGSYAVPEYTGEPEGDADFDGAEYYVMRVATCQVYSGKKMKDIILGKMGFRGRLFVIDIF